MGRKYCVYTSNMTGPAGMSLIMEPSKVEAAAPLLNDNPLDNFLTRAQAEELYLGKPPYQVVDIPGKGKGVLATRHIAKFETIMVDQASVVVALNVEKMIGKLEARKLLYKAVEQLRVPGEVRRLSGEHSATSEGDAGEGELGKVEEDVMLTNSFGSRVEEVDCRALFPLISVRLASKWLCSCLVVVRECWSGRTDVVLSVSTTNAIQMLSSCSPARALAWRSRRIATSRRARNLAYRT
jgi:hypothetical protein